MSDSEDDGFLFGDGVDMSDLGEAMCEATKNDETPSNSLENPDLISALNALETLILQPPADVEAQLEQFISTLAPHVQPEALEEIKSHITAILGGRFLDVLTSSLAQSLVREPSASELGDSTVVDVLRGRLDDFLDDESGVVGAFRLLLTSIASLNCFLQLNYTGPEIEESSIPAFPLCPPASEVTPGSRGAALDSLVVDGELPYPSSQSVHLFFFSRVLFAYLSDPTYPHWGVPVRSAEKGDSLNETYDALDRTVFDERPRSKCTLTSINSSKKLKSAVWWSARAVVCHQRMLIAGDPTHTLWKECADTFHRMLTDVNTTSNPSASTLPQSDLGAEAWLEWGLAEYHFNRPDSGKKAFDAAKRTSALNVEMSAALGKRTKYQTKALPQMVLKAQHTATATSPDTTSLPPPPPPPTPATSSAPATSDKPALPEVMAQAEDSILLEKVAFNAEAVEEGTTEELSSIHLAVVLALCLDVKNSNPKDGLTTEEMRPYVERVLLHHANWTLYSTGLLQRAWLDFESYYSKDRATLQLQALVDQHTTKLTITQMSQSAIDESSPAQDRLRYLHCIVYPPRWELKKDLAKRYQELGVLVSASQLFEELELWDDVVDCYATMGKKKEARALVQERRKIAPDTPRMLCALADLSKPPQSTELYEQAWELSGKRYAKAKKSLGREAFEMENWEAAEHHLEQAVKVVPSWTSEWFILGTVRMRMEKWQEALTAFSTVVCHNSESGDAWGNVGAIHLRLKRPDLALTAFTEGLKYNRESWRMWENRLLSALQIRPTPKASDAILCVNQLMDLHKQGAGRGVDAAMLAAVTSAALANEGVSPEEPLSIHPAAASESLFASRLVARQMNELLNRVTSTTSFDPKVWEVCALFHSSLGSLFETRTCRLKHLRALSSKAGWEKNIEQMTAIADAIDALTHVMSLALPEASPESEKKEIYSCAMLVKGLLRKAGGDSALASSGDEQRARIQASLDQLNAKAEEL